MRAGRVLAMVSLGLLWCGGCAGSPARVSQAQSSGAEPPVAAPAPAHEARPTVAGLHRRPSLRETRVISELMRSAEDIRQLKFARAVPVWVEDRARITAYVGTQIEEEELERARVVYTALGLLPAALDVRALLLRLLGEQVVGYYDADEKQLVVRDDIMRGFTQTPDASAGDAIPDELAEARIVLLHELVHALQDQRLGLSTQIHADRDTDASNAFHALVEGDATLAMLGYALQREQIPLSRLTGNPAQARAFSDVVRRSPLAGSELEQAPAIVRVPLLSSYVDGLVFCAYLHGRGGFALVDAAHAQPPLSTEQVLHPERYSSAPDAPTPITLPDLGELATTGYALVREDTLGELELSVYFGQAGPPEHAKRAADGWDGDRIRVYRRTDSSEPAAVVWLSAWDNEREAEQAQAAAERVRALGDKAAQQRSGVYRHGSWLLVLRELPPALRSVVAERLLSAH